MKRGRCGLCNSIVEIPELHGGGSRSPEHTDPSTGKKCLSSGCGICPFLDPFERPEIELGVKSGGGEPEDLVARNPDKSYNSTIVIGNNLFLLGRVLDALKARYSNERRLRQGELPHVFQIVGYTIRHTGDIFTKSGIEIYVAGFIAGLTPPKYSGAETEVTGTFRLRKDGITNKAQAWVDRLEILEAFESETGVTTPVNRVLTKEELDFAARLLSVAGDYILSLRPQPPREPA